MPLQQRLALGSILVGLTVLGLKALAWAMTGSVALLSDALESLVNVATAVAALPRIELRGLMAIPAPHPDTARRIDAFRRMQALQDQLAAKHPGVDTLSMGMSDDYALAVAHGATMVRIGTALFGARPARTA